MVLPRLQLVVSVAWRHWNCCLLGHGLDCQWLDGFVRLVVAIVVAPAVATAARAVVDWVDRVYRSRHEDNDLDDDDG